MTNKTEMVSLPRELAQELDDLLYILTGNNSSQKLVRKYGAAFWLKLDGLRNPLCKALAAPPEDVREVVDEPVAWMQFDGEGGYDFTDDHETGERWMNTNGPKWVTPLYRHPQRKVVMPERRDYDVGMRTSFGEGWNACLDEFARLNGECK